MKARILIVDDHEIVREGVRSLLTNMRPEWEICGEAANADDAIAAAKEQRPDVIVLDITMPGMSGLEAAKQMRKLGLNSPVLMFTMHESARLATDVRLAGGRGYVLKSQANRDLVRAIDAILGGGSFFGGPIKPEPDAGAKGGSAPGIAFFASFGPALAWGRG